MPDAAVAELSGFVKEMDEFGRRDEGVHLGKWNRLRRSGVGGYAALKFCWAFCISA